MGIIWTIILGFVIGVIAIIPLAVYGRMRQGSGS
jgi:uncharacterized membrane protein YeaQ/YmgE (transglycosylase-associated protein family)